jgi:hypothetical protein
VPSEIEVEGSDPESGSIAHRQHTGVEAERENRNRRLMTSAVLIPGAGGLGWYWHLVERDLQDRGYDAFAVDLAAGGQTGLPAYAAGLAGPSPPPLQRLNLMLGRREWWRRSGVPTQHPFSPTVPAAHRSQHLKRSPLAARVRHGSVSIGTPAQRVLERRYR